MNKKLKMLNCLLALCLIVAMMAFQAVPALALDDEETTTPTETTTGEPQEGPTATGDAGECNDTAQEETPPEGQETALTASTVEELLQAIDQAEAGAIIGVGCEIVCPDGTTLGSPDKAVTIQRTAPEGHVILTNGDGTGSATIQNITFDGAGVESFFSYVAASLSATFTNCSFINCSGSDGAALILSNGTSTLTGCTFDDNSGQQGAHLRIDSGSVTVENSTFTDATATGKGGAIMNCSDQKATLTGCTITGNTTSAQHGGGIWNSGILDVSQCKIYGNTANDEADDLVNEYWGRLALMDDHSALVALYAADGVTPNKWAVDTFTEGMGPEGSPNMIFSMTFADSEPAPEPEPDPEPTPDPVPTPTPSQPSTGHTGGHSTPATPTPKETTLTNGKAVLKAPEALFWTGYETGHGGAAEAVTRADLAALMVSLMDADTLKAYTTETAAFDDVPGSSPAIGTANSAGIMLGCGLGSFHPERVLTWGELLTVLSRFTNQEEPPAQIYTGDHWAGEAVNTAIGLGWISYSETFDPGGPVTCGDMVGLIQTVFQWAGK